MENRENKLSPPAWAVRFFEFYCDPYIAEELHGDLLDRFYSQAEKLGAKKARRNYVLNVFKFLGFHTLKRRTKTESSNFFFLLPNYFKTGTRSLLRQGTFSLINLSGLSLGLICFMLLFGYVKHELSFDSIHSNKNEIARVNMTWIFGDTRTPTSEVTSIVASLLADNIPEIRNTTRFNNQGAQIVKYDNKIFKEESFLFADSTLFDVFTYELVQGNPKQCLTKPNSLLLSESVARKYFGDERSNESLLGETFTLNNKDEYIVTGIFKDVPANTHVRFDFLASMSSLSQAHEANWNNSEFATYVLVYPGSTFTDVQEKAHDVIMASDADGFVELHVEPMSTIYLHSEFNNHYGPQSNFRNVLLFGGIAFLILIIACINYLNLVTAKSAERAKEVGLRKVLGAFRSQLFFQFMSESLLLCFSALILAFGSSLILVDYFNYLAGQKIPFSVFTSFNFIMIMAGITFVVSLLAGSYPSLVISGFKPVKVLKGKFISSQTGALTRKILIVLQFATSMFLIIGTLVVFDQLSYIQNKSLGFDKDHILILPVDNEMKKNLSTVKNEVQNVPGVVSTSYVSHTPGNITFMTTFQILETDNPRQLMNAAKVDADFLEMSGIDLVYGSNFSDNSNYEEEYGFLLNEAALDFFGWTPEEALGQRVGIWGGEKGVVMGIIKDFHNKSLHTQIDKLILFNDSSSFFYSNLMVKVEGENLTNTISSLSDKWKTVVPHRPFEFTFLDDKFMQSYNSETKLSRLFTVFAGIAIFIACLGLLGLSAYNAVQKSKEMSVRKVLGASTLNILGRFTWEFIILIIVAFVVATPLSYLASEKWLEGFAYKTELSFWLFITSGLICLFVTMITVSLQSLKVATINPAITLKNNE